MEFMRVAINAKCDGSDKISVTIFPKKLDEKMVLLDVPEEMAECYLNEGLSGGEKKQSEILQLLILEPTFVILDEIDPGLNVGTLKVVTEGVGEMCGDSFDALIITHYQWLLNYIIPDVVHITVEGRVAMTGNADLAKCLEAEGYAGISKELGIDHKKEEV